MGQGRGAPYFHVVHDIPGSRAKSKHDRCDRPPQVPSYGGPIKGLPGFDLLRGHGDERARDLPDRQERRRNPVLRQCNDSQLPALSTEESIDLFSHYPGVLHPGRRLFPGIPTYCPPLRGGGGFEEEHTGTRLREGGDPLPGPHPLGR